jgi:hypothetical protein
MSILLLLLALTAPAPQAGLQGSARAGWEAIQNGEAEKAASAFREALSANPRDALSQAGAGVAAHLLGRDDEAERALKRALELNPDLSYASYMLAQVAYAQGELDLAIRSLDRAIKGSPGSRTLTQQLEQWKKEAALHDSFSERPGARFTILFEGPAQKAIADRVNAVLEQAYVRIGHTLNEYPAETITAILYTRQQFRDITRSPSWAGGVYDGRIRIPVQGALRAPTELDRIVVHEYVHAVLHSLVPRGVPTWLNEGLATYLEPGDHTWLTQRLRTATPIPLDRLEDSFEYLNGEEAMIAYAESAVAARVLVERLGTSFPTFLQYVANGTPLDEALLLFKISPADIQREWSRRAGTR